MTNPAHVAALCVAASLSIPAAQAQAQDWTATATVGLGFGEVSDTDTSFTSYTIDASGRVRFDSGFSMGLDLGYTGLESDDISGSASITSFAVAPRYRFANRPYTVGGYVEYASLDDTGLSGSLDATSYGLTGGYVGTNWRTEVFWGLTDTDPEIGPDTDIQDYGISLGVLSSDRLSFAGNLIRTSVEDSGVTVNADLFEIASTYQFGNGFGLFGSVSHMTISSAGDSVDMNTIGIGGSYYLGNTIELPLTVSLELAQSEVNYGGYSGDMSTVRLGLTLPIGGSGGKLPLNSTAGAVQNGRHSAITSSVLSTF
ncbi:outer membrane beta-barrel protein [Psychromarinibacter halotolerans]|uniref:Outer membrane beta-barrel protein n=1 Tax=Psychromarinibacter halotolerans TaxID=1775175 RepID=A0ABV7GZV0_9RHOB|nr:outer membrane beta-barrel protein [Psychromarinibacter halotolerans]MDF0598578.1 hypothetical protein [Psychromarinibacter halotolerans]